MSFEGYYQYLCKAGHEEHRDVYDEAEKVCPCGEPFVWRNTVDTTNGSVCGGGCRGCEYCDNGNIDGYVDLEFSEKYITEDKCPTCNHTKVTTGITYKIPEGKGTILPSP